MTKKWYEKPHRVSKNKNVEMKSESDEYGLKQLHNDNREGIFIYKEKAYGRSIFRREWIDWEPKNIFDVGSYRGGDSLRFSLWFPSAQIYSFEGCPGNYEEVIKTKSLVKNMNSYNYIVSDKVEIMDFHQWQINEKDGPGTNWSGPEIRYHGSIYPPAKMVFHNFKHLSPIEKTQVQSTTIDKFCDDHQIKEIDMIHIDAEGAGYEIITGMNKILPKLIFIERENRHLFQGKKTGDNELIKLLNNRGYKIKYSLHNDILLEKII